jgi:hypothetical protein
MTRFFLLTACLLTLAACNCPRMVPPYSGKPPYADDRTAGSGVPYDHGYCFHRLDPRPYH